MANFPAPDANDEPPAVVQICPPFYSALCLVLQNRTPLRLSVFIATELALSRTRHFDLKYRPGSFLYDRNGFWLFYRKSTLDISADDR
ncbi:uncharacterized protein METZ01_LOCUS362708, partial [marine metagenome]